MLRPMAAITDINKHNYVNVNTLHKSKEELEIHPPQPQRISSCMTLGTKILTAIPVPVFCGSRNSVDFITDLNVA